MNWCILIFGLLNCVHGSMLRRSQINVVSVGIIQGSFLRLLLAGQTLSPLIPLVSAAPPLHSGCWPCADNVRTHTAGGISKSQLDRAQPKTGPFLVIAFSPLGAGQQQSRTKENQQTFPSAFVHSINLL